jgi:hypothetical protein
VEKNTKLILAFVFIAAVIIAAAISVSAILTGAQNNRNVTVLAPGASYIVSISEVPAAAAATWGVCFRYTGNSNLICLTGNGKSTGTATIPTGRTIDYLCTTNSAPTSSAYSWGEWTGTIARSSSQCSDPNVAVRKDLSIIANYNKKA